jgi:exonuclease III
MIALSLNCRGLGLDSAVGELWDLVRSYNPEVVFLCETKKRAGAMERLKWSLGFKHGVFVDCKGKGGGLALLWKEGLEVSVRPWCQYFIDASIKLGDTECRFTGIYGEPRTKLRQKTWDALRYLRAHDELPWICVGDFNEIAKQEEQLGGKTRSLAQMERFRDCLTDCGLSDLGFSGYPFTWNNKRDGQDNIQARLDRATCNCSFSQLFPATMVEHIATEESDHFALLIKVQESFTSTSACRPRHRAHGGSGLRRGG